MSGCVVCASDLAARAYSPSRHHRVLSSLCVLLVLAGRAFPSRRSGVAFGARRARAFVPFHFATDPNQTSSADWGDGILDFRIVPCRNSKLSRN